MARTRKSIQPLNLYKYDVLIEDKATRSDYFKVTQFDGNFYGGRNAFLLAGTGVLRPNSKILVEILNKDGTTVYSAPITSFIEGNSRLVQIEVYSDTPIGPGKIVLLGCADTYLDGTPVPANWEGKYNVRWITDVIISPLIENKTPIRFEATPSIVATEKFYYTPSSSQFVEQIKVPVDIELTQKYYNVFPNGYLAKISGPGSTTYNSDYLGGVITGAIALSNGTVSTTSSINIPITKIYNGTLGESQGTLIYINNTLLSNAFLSSSGIYATEIEPFGLATISSSINIQYNKLTTLNTGSAVSFAKLRLVDLKTISGEIHKIRLSHKATTEPGEFVSLGDINTTVAELLAVDSSSRIAETGQFTDIKIDDYWYSETMSLQKNEANPTLPAYYISSSLSSSYLPIVQSSVTALDSITATPQIVTGRYINDVSYFIGTKNTNTIQVFPRVEYTLAFDAIVSNTSASVALNQTDYSLEVYLVAEAGYSTKLLDTNPRGQLLGTLTPTSTFQRQNFEGTEFNFIPKIIATGNFGLRFIAYGGFWNIGNVSVKAAQEPFFSPDEIDILISNVNYADKILTFKAEYLDVNNNSIGLSTLSLPTYFTGSETTLNSGTSISASYAETASFISHTNPGSNRVITSLGSGSLNGEGNLQFDGSTLSVTGSMVISGSSTLRNIGPAQFTGSVSTTSNVLIGGNVGIGTTSPGTMLHVQGNISASNIYAANQTLSGSLYVRDNLFVYGSSSIQYITSSQLNIGTNLITVNVQNPVTQFGGLAVIDSGSSPQRSGSLLFDSIKDQWIFVHQNQTSPTSSVLLMGPQTYGNIGNETNLTNNYLIKSVNAEHVGDSQVYDDGTNVVVGGTNAQAKLTVFTGNDPAVDYGFSVGKYPRQLVMGYHTASNYGFIISTETGVGYQPLALQQFGGNVGIGTTSPSQLLHISSAGTAKLKISADTDNVTETDLGGIEISQDGGITTAYFGHDDANNLILGVNSTTSPAIYISTRNDGTNFVTASDAKVTITNTGNVGIGTTSPPSRLTVLGNISGSAAIDSRGSQGRVIIQNSAGGAITLYSGSTSVGSILASNGGGGLRINDTNNYNITFTAQGAALDTVFISSSGTVGIGTITPTNGKLHIYDNINGTFEALNLSNHYSAGTSGTAIKMGYTEAYYGVRMTAYHQPASYYPAELAFERGNGSGYSESMRIDRSGNVGIGTASPSGLLTIYSGSTGGLGGHIVLNNNGLAVANETALIFGDGSSTAYRAVIATITENAPYYGAIAFRTGVGAYSAITEKMRITGTGNVGIGITNPYEKFVVSSAASDFAITAYQALLHARNSAAGGGWARSFRVAASSASSDGNGITFGGFGNALGLTYGYMAIPTADLTGYDSTKIISLVSSSGNVGIGTTNPTQKLEVSGAIALGGITLAAYESSYHKLYRRDEGVGIYLGGADPANYYDNTAHFFRDRSSNTRMTINSAGYVGIGTTGPTTKLEVYGGHSDTLSRLYSTGNGATADASLDMWASEPGVTYYGSGIGNNINGTPYSGRRNASYGQAYIRFYDGNMRFVTTGSVVSGAALTDAGSMTITSAGNVGIGTTTPSALLHVSGTMAVQSIFEKVTVTASAAPATLNYNILDQAILFHSASSTVNWTLNFRGNASTTLNSVMSTGQSLTTTLMVLNAATAYSASAYQIDGTSITPRWQGGTSGSANANSLDAHTFTIIKTSATPTYVLLGSITKYT